MRRAARIDLNQPEIVKALRQLGCSVHPLHMVGRGFPDVACGYRGNNYFFEIKNGALSPSQRLLTEDEIKWHDAWRGQVAIIESIPQAISFIQERS